MGMFDRVWFRCPKAGCERQIEVQSKAGECCLAVFDESEVPLVIAADIGGETVWCPGCSNTYTVGKLDAIPGTVAMRLVGGVCEHCGK